MLAFELLLVGEPYVAVLRGKWQHPGLRSEPSSSQSSSGHALLIETNENNEPKLIFYALMIPQLKTKHKEHK